MSSEEPSPAPEEENPLSKKELAKLERQRKRLEAAAASATAAVSSVTIEADPLAANYGEIPLNDLLSKEISGKKWTEVKDLAAGLKDQEVLIRGAAQAIGAVGKNVAFLVVRERGFTVHCVLNVAQDLVSPQMVKFATRLSRESIIDAEGIVSVPAKPITGTTQQVLHRSIGSVSGLLCVAYLFYVIVASRESGYLLHLHFICCLMVEIQVRKLYCVNKAIPTLPFNIEDAANSEVEIEKAVEAGEPLVRVNQDTRLNYRVLDLRTPANQGIFRIQCQVENIFWQFLLSEGFVDIDTPKLIAGSSEGGSAVFRLDYKGTPACLAQSPQLHKQMSICGGFGRVMEIGPVFRAEDTFTHRHLCEFTGLDVEMEIKEHYSEVMDVVDRLFVAIFDGLNETCSKELEFINRQYPFQKLKYLRKTLRLTFEEGVRMLKEAGVEIDPLGDLNTESERKLGQLVLEKYDTEFFILHRYPLGVRPFYTMPCVDNPNYSNSFDVFIRGEEIISGAQRVHVPELLTERAQACGIDVETEAISTYIDSFRYGAPPHGGFGVGLERVEPFRNPAPEEENPKKKLSKKELAKLERQRKRQEAAAASAVAAVFSMTIEADPLAANYGEIPLNDLLSKEISGKKWTEVKDLAARLKDQEVLIRGSAQAIRAVGKNVAFVVVRKEGFTVQCVLSVAQDVVSPQMVKFATRLSRESIIDVEGIVSVPENPISGTTQQVEIQVRKLYCVNKAIPTLPINIEDASKSEVEIEKALEAGEQLVRVNQDTRLNYRVLDLRTPANQGIFRIKLQVKKIFKQFLLSEGFVGIHTPKLIAGSSEGGSAVFSLDDFGTPACLAQSPQLHKQMSTCGGFGHVFEIGPVFRAEDSFTHRHLCQFTGLDVEMEIKEHYSEVMDVVDRLFVAMFDSLNETCSTELEVINRQYPFQKLKYLRKTLRLTFEEGVRMLKEAGVEIDPIGDLNTESERKLGQLVLEKYDTEFFILHRYPLGVRPFYTMPCVDNPNYSNSFDVFIRGNIQLIDMQEPMLLAGEEIISGAQRVHVPELLTERAQACGIDVETEAISTYIDSFRYGAPPHGGFVVGLERVVMLFCALNNIRKTSLFPRDPRRIAP
ncbi:aspartate--tRNA ligase [Striga asiatica]|uniref:aspartate--tRNA ligase n=1 Tax=Striga asiatica TaxID=4170 RepID=A0A5A7PJ11_STRAF|nr:aspartate--tRNA ligase [Striga asiatica]